MWGAGLFWRTSHAGSLLQSLYGAFPFAMCAKNPLAREISIRHAGAAGALCTYGAQYNI